MSGFSSLSSMITSLKGNKALIPSKKTLKDLSSEFNRPSVNKEPLHYEVKISIAEREEKLAKLQTRRRKSQINFVIICFVILIATIASIVWFNSL